MSRYFVFTTLADLFLAGSSGVIALVNVALIYAMRKFSRYEKHHNMDHLEVSLFHRVFVLLFLNTGLVMMITSSEMVYQRVIGEKGGTPDFTAQVSHATRLLLLLLLLLLLRLRLAAAADAPFSPPPTLPLLPAARPPAATNTHTSTHTHTHTQWYNTTGAAITLIMIVNIASPHAAPLLRYWRSSRKRRAMERSVRALETVTGADRRDATGTSGGGGSGLSAARLASLSGASSVPVRPLRSRGFSCFSRLFFLSFLTYSRLTPLLVSALTSFLTCFVCCLIGDAV
jgi:hypothetical protein